ncbi:AraC family transcriptional regulator [Trinickia dabaoshanensis]|uniref:AraC family transcriptional regulator n=1 Tax=Trinickia dabaoshanensis TaxID=564714 RepID=A0A2N7VLQ5_9BURK|nr:AraC family transcriptional regulator [Trinickia dabaoshanensis]
MDALSDALALLKPMSYAFRGLDAGERWALGFAAAEGIKCYVVHSGACWLRVDGIDVPIRLHAGDCVLLARGRAFRLDSQSDVPALDAEQFFSEVPAGELAVLDGGGSCSGVGGYFDFAARHAEHLLRELPPVLHFTSEADKAALRTSIERLMRELREPAPGSALIAEHVAQTLLVDALRLHLSHAATTGPGWLLALADTRMNAVLSAMHARPGHRWTLESLAREGGMSRSGFAAHFKASVGMPALEYLTQWRMLVAADRLAKGRDTISVVAPAVGYESESAFGAAFKRVMGCAPGKYIRDLRDRA